MGAFQRFEDFVHLLTALAARSCRFRMSVQRSPSEPKRTCRRHRESDDHDPKPTWRQCWASSNPRRRAIPVRPTARTRTASS